MGRIIAIDDDPALLGVLRDILVDAGQTVDCAQNPGEAEHLLTNGAVPCVILLDSMMPGHYGWDFHAYRRRTPRIADVPVVMMTSAEPMRARPPAAGVLEKPFELADLLELVERYCPPDDASDRDSHAA